MPNDCPDWVEMVQVVVVVEGLPIVLEPTTEAAVDGYGTKTTSSSDYQEVTSWTVTAKKLGILSKIELSCDNYTVAQWKVTVDGVDVLSDDALPSRMTKDFADMKLAAGAEVTVKVKSDGSTTITAYADIDCKEIG